VVGVGVPILADFVLSCRHVGSMKKPRTFCRILGPPPSGGPIDLTLPLPVPPPPAPVVVIHETDSDNTLADTDQDTVSE
jgi:hypothetical protein